MPELLDARQERILLAVLKEYISTAEPVSSSFICQNYDLGCCPATVRNDMAKLEELGYLVQPHTSAGRIPLDKAYRFYVNRLLGGEIVLPPEADVIRNELQSGKTDIEFLIDQSCRLLSQITRHTALILGPNLRRSVFKFLKLVPVSSRTILLVLLNNTGAVLHKVVELSSSLPPEELERMTNLLNDRLHGMPLCDISTKFLKSLPALLDAQILFTVSAATQELAREAPGRVVCGGTSHLLSLPEFHDLQKLRVIMEILEEEQILAEILNKTLSGSKVQALIGGESDLRGVKDCAVITASYYLEGEPVGTVGILGPMRLPYDRIISVVNFMAEVFSEKLQEYRNL